MYLNECRHMGITVLAPDVNESALNFTPVGNDIRFGMGAIRNVGANVVNALVEARAEKGNFENFADFLQKVPAVVCNKRTIESLIKAGAFDSMGHARRALVAIHEEAVDSVISVKRNEAANQFDLFSAFDDPTAAAGMTVSVPDMPDWEKKDKLAFERDMLGLYVSDHPLKGLGGLLEQNADMSVTQVLSDDGPQDGHTVTICGMITSLQRRIAKKSGNPYARCEIEDLSGSMETMFFGNAYAPIANVLAEDLIVVVKGRVQKRDDGSITLNAQELTVPEISEDGEGGPVVISMANHKATEEVISALGDVLRVHQGTTEVRVKLHSTRGVSLMRLGMEYRVNPNSALFGDLKVLLGPTCLDG